MVGDHSAQVGTEVTCMCVTVLRHYINMYI
jgi:hypothetical protein